MRQSRRCRGSHSLRLFLPEAQSRGTPRRESPPPGWTRSHLPPALAPGSDFLPLAVAPPKGFTVTFPCHRCYWREALWPAPGRRQGPASLLPFPEPLGTGKTRSRSCSRCRCADHRAPVRLDPETPSPAQEKEKRLHGAVWGPRLCAAVMLQGGALWIQMQLKQNNTSGKRRKKRLQRIKSPFTDILYSTVHSLCIRKFQERRWALKQPSKAAASACGPRWALQHPSLTTWRLL
ncbi:uncharacterized protein [Equus asinus]|uniref:uncharacterized protein isoform X1 n=1 Tax=Equus asinus TaxID=9793 RepID=UPI001D04E686|nr:uncharacterized protein LOC106838994 [Equus asinus]